LEEKKSTRDPEATGRKTDGENRKDDEVKQQREKETKTETDGGGEEADRKSLGGQHWHSQRGTAGSMES